MNQSYINREGITEYQDFGYYETADLASHLGRKGVVLLCYIGSTVQAACFYAIVTKCM